jgi:hypothetical protein
MVSTGFLIVLVAETPAPGGPGLSIPAAEQPLRRESIRNNSSETQPAASINVRAYYGIRNYCV